jgi:hypothetical protein
MIRGKNIVLTGCNSGIGLEVLKLLITGGNNILCVDKDIDVLKKYENHKVFVLQKDVSSKEAVDEIFKLAEYLDYYYLNNNMQKHSKALEASCKLKPTAGLGITDSDLEELGAESYQQVDYILQEILAWKRLSIKRGDFPESSKEQRDMFLDEQQMLDTPTEIILNVTNRHFNSEFKRKQMPIKIERDSIL